jgi:SNF2 family DNA or RNA helicase
MDYKFKTKPYKHQLKALEKSWKKKNFALFCEMGTGKSKILLDNISMLYDAGKINAAIIVAPKGVYKNWVEQEIPKHIPDHIDCRTFYWVAPSQRSKQDKEMMEQIYSETRNPCLTFFVMNVEAFSTQPGKDAAEKFMWAYKTLMAVDESTSIKTPTATRTRNILSAGMSAPFKRIMTGSPVTKSPLDLFSQCDFLDSELLGHDSFYSFRARYANMQTINLNGRSVNIVRPYNSYRNLGELSDVVSQFSYRILKEDCLDLPEKIYQRRVIQMTPEQKRAYESMKSIALAELNNKVCSTMNVLTQMLRLHQITCGHFKADDGTVTALKNNRLAELLDVLDECEGKVIIWSNYVADIELIAKELGKKYGKGSFCTYYGGTKQAQRQKNIENFQDKDSEVRFFIGNAQTGGYGITLTAATTVVYYSNSYDLEKRLQSEDRAHRIGQTNKVNYVDIICDKSVDEKIVKALRQKINIANEILGEELREWL